MSLPGPITHAYYTRICSSCRNDPCGGSGLPGTCQRCGGPTSDTCLVVCDSCSDQHGVCIRHGDGEAIYLISGPGGESECTRAELAEVAPRFILSSPGRRTLADQLLRGMAPRDLVAFCDMSGTLLFHGTDAGFPILLRQLLCEFVRDRGILVLVTGDSLPVVRAEFLKRLPLRSRRPVYLITGSGHRFDAAYRRGGRWSIRNLARGRELDPAVRESLLAAACRVLRQSFGLHPRAPIRDAKVKLLSPRGGRIDLSQQFTRLAETTWLEGRAYKLTLFFPEHAEVGGLPCRLLDALAADSEINRIAADERLHVVRGGNFVDIIVSDKGAAVKRFYELVGKPLASRYALLLGDSSNDLPMFEAELPAAGVIRVFLGSDRGVARRIEAVDPGRSVHLAGEHVAGATFVFDLVTRGAT